MELIKSQRKVAYPLFEERFRVPAAEEISETSCFEDEEPEQIERVLIQRVGRPHGRPRR